MANKVRSLSPQVWKRAILFSAAYLAAALLSREISFQTSRALVIWLPGGLFVAALLLAETRSWPAYLLAALPASLAFSLLTGQPWLAGGLLYLTCVLEAVAGAWLVRRFDHCAGEFRSPGNVLYLIVFSALISSALAASFSTTLQFMLQRTIAYWSAWRVVWIGHCLGILVTAPLILAWSRIKSQDVRAIKADQWIELSVLTIGLAACSVYIFLGNASLYKQSYLVVPFLVWMALRFGPPGITASGLMVALISTWGTTHQLQGFFVQDSAVALTMESLGSFLAITLVSCDLLATTWTQKKHSEITLRESESRYRLLIENQGEGVGAVDAQEIFTFANPAALQIFGVSDLLGHSLKEFTDPRQFRTIREQTGLRKSGMKTSYEVEIVQPGGKHRSLLVTATPEYTVDGDFTGTFAVFYDITSRKLAEIALRDSRARFQALFDHSPIAILEVDFSRVKRLLDGLRRQGINDFRDFFQQHPEQAEACKQLIHVTDANQATLQLYNFADKATFLSQVYKVFDRAPRDLLIEEFIAISEGKTWFEKEGPNDLIEDVVRHHSIRWTVAPGYEKDYHRVVMTVIDMTERRRVEDRMQYLSTHDVLTGLYNRNFFETEMDRLENGRGEPVNIMMVDVNGMKATNDTFGHSAGDELLRRTAHVLRTSFRKEDIIARIGGDEFVVLFHGSISIQDAFTRVKEALVEHNRWFNDQPLSLAIGAAAGNPSSSLLELFKKADQQMYKEKLRLHKTRNEIRPS